MMIEILYFLDCPNYLAALANLREAMRQQQVTVEVAQVEVHDQAMAEAIKFLGSPTIRINGMDIEPGASTGSSFGLCCRTYVGPSATRGAPAVELIGNALREASRSEREECCE